MRQSPYHTQNKRDRKPECAVRQESSQNKHQFYLQCEVERLEKAFVVFQLNKVGCFHRITVEKWSREDFSERSRHRFSKLHLSPKLNIFMASWIAPLAFWSCEILWNLLLVIWFPLDSTRLYKQHLNWPGLTSHLWNRLLSITYLISFSPFLSQNLFSRAPCHGWFVQVL